MIRKESDFTAPRPECPRPDWWSAPDAESTEVEVTELVAAFCRALQPEAVLETGTAYAFTAMAMGEALKKNRHGHLYTLEFNAKRVEEATAKVRGLPVTVIPSSSLDWTPPLPFGFAWFDSTTDIRAREFLHFKPWLPRGIVAGFHDTGPQHVTRSLLEPLVQEGWLRPIYLPTPRGVAFAEVLK